MEIYQSWHPSSSKTKVVPKHVAFWNTNIHLCENNSYIHVAHGLILGLNVQIGAKISFKDLKYDMFGNCFSLGTAWMPVQPYSKEWRKTTQNYSGNMSNHVNKIT